MKLTLAFSPCPNDAFIFDAIANKKIDLEGLEFDILLGDVETLNHWALHGRTDITKLSYHAYAYVSENYILLNSGSALGRGCGPLLISKDEIPKAKLEYCVIGIPGRLTTANLLLSLAFPSAITKKEMVFSEIEDALLHDEIDAGAIIHENRFTYEQKGLKKILDLGAYWEDNFHAPIPLGAIAVKRELDAALQKKIDRIIRRSLEHAFSDPAGTMPYVRMHAQAMEETVMQQHIALYVNDFSLDLGVEGKEAVKKLYAEALNKNIIKPLHEPIFLQ